MFIPNGTDKYYAELRNTKDGEPYLSRIKALKEFINWYKSI
jgi:inosine/xanthosine triphosphate pyrophosphatase family protein